MNLQSREKGITRTSLIGIGVNTLLVIFKMIVGLLSGSISIVLDAVNNLADALSSIITIIGIKLSKRQPDTKHPYGYGRVEYFSAILISLLVTFAGVTSLKEAIAAIIHPEIPDYTLVTIVIVVVSVIVKLLLGKFVSAQGERYNSEALITSGKDASLDSLISASTLLGAAAALLFHISIDGILGTIIALIIIKAGLESLFEALSHVMGNRADGVFTKEIKQAIASVPEVLGAYDLILHDYGPDSAIGSVHVEIPGDLSASKVHEIIMHIQELVYEKYHIFMTVGIYAVDVEDQEKAKMREDIRALCKTFDGVLNAHGIFIDKNAKAITMDILVDFSIKDKKAFTDMAAAKISEMLSGYTVKIKLDTNYSD